MRVYNAVKRLGIAWVATLLVAVAPTCNPLPTFWPTDISRPPEWGVPCWADVTEYTVYGQVTVYEDTPLEGAEVRVNRIIGTAQTGAGAAISDADGDYRIEVDGHADALRIYIIYPPEYEAWGVQAPVGSWGLTLIHWPNPPASCGPIWWKAAYRETPAATVTATPSQTPTATRTPTLTRTPTRTATRVPTRTLAPTATRTPTRAPTKTATQTATATYTPTQTHTPTATPTATQTSTPTVTPTRTVTPTPAPFYLVVPPELRMTPAPTQGERQEQVIIIAVYAVNLLRIWTYIMAAMAGLGVAQNVIKWKRKE